MLPLPEPDPAGDLTPLAGFVRRGDDDDSERIVLLTGWLIGTFQTDGGRAILELLGEQGSGKTLLARLLRRIVDPNAVPLRTMPRDERDLVIAASNSLIVTADNASELKDWQSDAFCRLSTGGGIGGRKLYTDLDEVVLDAQRSSLITGINAVATRGDLLDRTLSVTLPPISATERRAEAVVWDEFERVHAHLLGGVLHAVATALGNRDRVNLPRKPRLADFIEFVEAAAPALGWDAGAFASAFEASRRNVDAVAIESLPIGPVLLAFLDQRLGKHEEPWEGTASALLHELVILADAETTRDRDWPKRGNRLSNQLRQLAPNLRQLGVSVEWDRSGPAGTRKITLSKKKDAADRQYRQNRQRSPETGPNDAKTQHDDGSSEDRPASSVDRQQTLAHAGTEEADNPHEQAKFGDATACPSVATDDTDDPDDSFTAFSDDNLANALLDGKPVVTLPPPDCLTAGTCERLGPCPRHAASQPCQINIGGTP